MAEMHTLQDCSGLVRQETLGTAPDVPVPRKTISTMVAIDEGERTRAGFVLLGCTNPLEPGADSLDLMEYADTRGSFSRSLD